jgi:hypothetical protein
MATLSKEAATAALLKAGIPHRSFTVPQFCARNGISLATYRNLKKKGKNPRETRPGGLDIVRITEEDETAWLNDQPAAETET